MVRADIRTLRQITLGVKTIPVEVFFVIFDALASFIHFFSRILVSKGWCITRRRLLKIEWRAVIGNPVAYLLN